MTDLKMQFLSMSIMLLFGILAAWLWDAEEVLTRILKGRKVLIGTVDFFSCCILAVIFWRILILCNNGIFRNYIVIGCVCGVFLYRKFLQRWGELFWQKVAHLLGRIFCLGRKFYRLGKMFSTKVRARVILPKVRAEKYSQDIAEEDMNSI